MAHRISLLFDIYNQCRYYGYALRAACARSQKEVLQLLLDKGADVNAQGGWYSSALTVNNASTLMTG